MKKILFISLFFIFAICHADSFFVYDNPFVPEWSFQIVYKEKYFEKTVYYLKYNIFDDKVYTDNSYTETLTGLEHNILLRFGLPQNYVLNICSNFIFQKVGIYDYNNLQTIDIYLEKRIEPVNIIAGLTLPLQFDMISNPYLINKKDYLNFITGFSVDFNLNLIKFSFLLFNQENINSGNNFSIRDIILTTGFDFISNELQKVGLYIENEIELNFLNNSLSYVYYFIPQIRLNFYNDFNLIIGIELYLLAQDVFINKYDMPQYIFKLNYIVSNIKKDIKEKEEKEKVKFVKKKWWQIEGVDDEMIPESWKELDEPESK